MADIFDYIDWRGDIGFDRVPVNEVDSMIFSQLIYVKMQPYMPDIKKSKLTIKQLADMYLADNNDDDIESMPNLFRNAAKLLKKIAKSKRFGRCLLTHYVYDISLEEESQFSAVTIELSDGSIFVSYSGTDHSVVGWKENFNLSYLDETPGQKKAKKYLYHVAKVYDADMWIGGHSKGGNLAVFAAMHVDKYVQKRIIKIFNLDGPGFNHKMISTEGYERIKSRIVTFLPQSSVVGLLLEHVDDYKVVKSTNSGPMQHDVFSWEVMGAGIVKADGLDKNSLRLDKTLKTWIGGMDEKQRKRFTEALFSIAEESNFENLDRLSFKQAIGMIKAADELSKSDWNVLKTTIKQLITAGVGTVRNEQ
ncbi:MAG: Mbeg1-like protein [Agathobacter sp.]|uniref:Mbeg1-like protein n=1 Tax=Agathobacter sp. TaxID=2021311 RepID=UPI0039925E3E